MAFLPACILSERSHQVDMRDDVIADWWRQTAGYRQLRFVLCLELATSRSITQHSRAGQLLMSGRGVHHSLVADLTCCQDS